MSYKTCTGCDSEADQSSSSWVIVQFQDGKKLDFCDECWEIMLGSAELRMVKHPEPDN